ncbi:MAG: hypothetical protein JKX97_01890 [Candidatus Lindowbacteria bacterium]|nr:hypothetical protein [Candidatus Lindowbacteria bacterium]
MKGRLKSKWYIFFLIIATAVFVRIGFLLPLWGFGLCFSTLWFAYFKRKDMFLWLAVCWALLIVTVALVEEIWRQQVPIEGLLIFITFEAAYDVYHRARKFKDHLFTTKSSA